MTAAPNSEPVEWSRANLELGEGPRWIDGRLVLVDILSGRLLEADGTEPGELRQLLRIDRPLGAVAPVAASADTWIAAVGTGIAFLSSSGDLTWLDRPVDGGVPRRMNDGACDPSGRFWAGAMAWDGAHGHGALFRTDADGTVVQVLDGLSVPNGPAFTADGSEMYLADSAAGVVQRFTVDPATGALGEPGVCLEITDGRPDGMTVDTNGNVWVAVWGRGEVRQYAPDGSLLTSISLPALQPTAPCLGGPDGRRLFITSATYQLPSHRLGRSGSVFAVDVAVPGTPASPYRPA